MGLEAGTGTSLRAEGPASLVDGDGLGLPQLPVKRQVVCLSLSLSSPITLWASGIMKQSTDLILLFAVDMLHLPLFSGKCSHSPL